MLRGEVQKGMENETQSVGKSTESRAHVVGKDKR